MTTRPQKEARSLSAINYLAANPPQYPYHPELRESLILYISRVPGTQDVILSTFRPLKKNVTAEDIANSLYYVHLNTPEDEALVAPPKPAHAVSPRSSIEGARSPIPRKPLPPSAIVVGLEKKVMNSNNSGPVPPPTTAVPGVPPTTEPAPLAPSPQIEPAGSDGDGIESYRQNPVFQKRQSAGLTELPPDPSGSPASPPLPPRPPKPMMSTLETISGQSSELSTTPVPDPRMTVPPMTPPRMVPNPGRPFSPMSQTSPRPPSQITSPGRPGTGPASAIFSLTIIRRDPTTGIQCNVGKILSFQTNVPTPETAAPNLDPNNLGELLPFTQHITIRLETSGYAKYRDLPSRADVGKFRLSSGASLAQQLSQMGVSGTSADTTEQRPTWKPVEQGFTREVVMAYGPSLTGHLKRPFHRRRRPGSPPQGGPNASGEGAPAPLHVSHTRQGSTSTIGSVDSSDGRHSPTLITQPGPGLKPKGYVFMSPWNGRCEFRTSANGRALKLRHVLDPGNIKFDPREVAQSIRDAQAIGRSKGEELASALAGAKPVSELRYNLPQSARHRRASEPDAKSKGGRHLPGRLNKILHQGSHSSGDEFESDDDDLDEDPSLDLTGLGRENAGGGSRGRRAKLGKLIIHDEGLKMLDLVVAANVGVWWTTWGRSD